MKELLLTLFCGLTTVIGQAQTTAVHDMSQEEDSILNRLSSYLVWVGVKFSNAIEEELLINDASQIGSKKFDFSIE